MWRVLPAAVLFLAACGGASGTATRTATQHTAIASPTTSVTPFPVATPTPVTCGPTSGGSTDRARITDMRIGTASGGDTLVIQFDTAVTHYDISPNPTGVQFAGGGGKGGTFTLDGTYGLRLTIVNLNWTVAPGNQYPHGTDLKQSAPTLLEVRQIGDFEGTVNIAIGLSGNVCPSVSILTGPSRLVLQFAGA